MRRSWASLSFALLGAAASALLASAVACSSFGTDPGSDTDGAAPTGTDGAASDASDGAASDAGYCAQHSTATVCTDFDTTDGFAPWTPSVSDGGASLMRSAEAFQSPLWSMFSSVESTPEIGSRLYFDIEKDAHDVRLGFDVKVRIAARQMTPDAAPDSTQVSLAEIYCLESGENGGLWLFYDVSDETVHAIAPASRIDLPLVKLGTEWTRIGMDASLDKQTATVTIGDFSMAVPFTSSCAVATVFQARVGLSSGPGIPAAAFYDNVLLEVDRGN